MRRSSGNNMATTRSSWGRICTGATSMFSPLRRSPLNVQGHIDGRLREVMCVLRCSQLPPAPNCGRPLVLAYIAQISLYHTHRHHGGSAPQRLLRRGSKEVKAMAQNIGSFFPCWPEYGSNGATNPLPADLIIARSLYRSHNRSLTTDPMPTARRASRSPHCRSHVITVLLTLAPSHQ